jgi:hypothetical protein
VWRWLLAAATLIGGFAALVTFLPRVSVSRSEPVDPSNPFSASFTITNESFIPLRDVGAAMGLGQIVTEPAGMSRFKPDFSSRITSEDWNGHALQMDEKFTITPSTIFALAPGAQLSGADVVIAVTYRPWILPFKREKLSRFVTHRQTNGRLYWYSAPLQ